MAILSTLEHAHAGAVKLQVLGRLGVVGVEVGEVGDGPLLLPQGLLFRQNALLHGGGVRLLQVHVQAVAYPVLHVVGGVHQGAVVGVGIL